jgi:hypothetical protein
MEFRMAVHNDGVIRIKGKVGMPREHSEFRVDMGGRMSIKTRPN